MRTQLLTLIILALLPRLSLAADSPADGIWVFEDATASLSFKDVVAMPDAFMQTTDTNLGFSDSAFWIRVEMTNDTDERQTQVVQFESFSLPVIEAYDDVGTVTKSGYDVPQTERPVSTFFPSFPVVLQPNEQLLRYFKVASAYEVSLGFNIRSEQENYAFNEDYRAIVYALILSLIVLVAYAVSSAFIIRKSVYWIYSGFLSFGLVAQLAQYQLIALPKLLVPVSSSISLGLGIIFLALMLNQSEKPMIRRLFLLYALSVLGNGIAVDSITAYVVNSKILAPAALAIMALQIGLALREKIKVARILLLGWLCFFLGAVAIILAVNGLIDRSFGIAYSVGAVAEALLFSIALAYRLRDQDQTAELLEQQRQTNERQKEMFAVIGHELRTPVASMAMVAKDSDTSDASARQHMESISSNLLSVLEDLRVVVAPERALESKLEVGHPANKIERAISPLKLMIEEAGFSVSLVLPAKSEKYYHFHAQPLRQLVTNLVKNAVVHSGGDKVRVELTLNEVDETQTQATLRICDNGKGLTKAEQQHVFEAFGRGDTSSDGSGLGLFIVSQLIKKMEGSLSYETSQLGGACFVVSFPLQVAEQEQEQDILSGLNILLAEDDSFLAQLIQKMLSAKGANVTVAENGQIALDAFQTHVMTQTFDVVITDLMMPELDGHELVKAIRESDTQIPVIAVTAAVIGQETDQLMAKGATAVLSKPIKMDELAEVLNKKRLENSA